MKVRARLKPYEDWPAWAKCCDGYRQNALDLGEVVVDLGNTRERDDLCCSSCDADRPLLKLVRNTVDGRYCPLDLLEFDEGAVE